LLGPAELLVQAIALPNHNTKKLDIARPSGLYGGYVSSQAYPNQSASLRNLQALDFDMLSLLIRKTVKRSFDIVMALIGLVLLFPVFVYVSFLIKRDSPGPVYYWGPRMGRGGKPFKILKFRTMYERSESYEGPPVTASGDDRITPLGHWLRDTKINELPQLWNVLKGEMSLVGPRPEDVEIAKTWPKDAFEEILSVSPGITSPASILYHDEEKLLSRANVMGDYLKSILPDKIRLDRLYVRHFSFFSDLDAIFWTIAIIIPQLSRSNIPEGYLFAGPISRLVHRYVNWFLIDFLVSLSVAYIASLMWGIGEKSNFGIEYRIILAFALAILFSGFNYVVGLNKVLWSRATVDDAIGVVVSGIFVTALIWILNYLQHLYHWFPFRLPASMILVIGIFATFGFLLVRYRLRFLTTVASRWLNWRQESSKVGERVLIAGFNEGTKIATYLLKQRTFRTAFSIVGVVENNNPAQHGMRVSGSWVLGGVGDIPELIKRFDIGVVLSTLPHNNIENEHIVEFCQTFKTKLIFLDDLLAMVNRNITQPLGVISSQTWLDGRLEFKATHDVLTGLPNRFLLQDRLRHSSAHAKRYKTRPALVFIEMDEIAEITSALDDKFGNEMLKGLAKRLAFCKRESDTLARIAYDRFALLLENIPSGWDSEIITERILASFSEPLSVGEYKFSIKPRLDICLCRQEFDQAGISEQAEIERFYQRAVEKIMNSGQETLSSREDVVNALN
jgi:diguanylate cyclase (GGDEF)-like protein